MSNNTTIAVPTAIVTDYIEATILICLSLAGFPLNISTAYKLYFSWKNEKGSRNCNMGKLSFIFLKIHLNVSDLLILCFYVTGRTAWLFTYEWLGGNFLCKGVHFMFNFVFSLSANIITAIALDRLHTVLTMHTPTGPNKIRVTKILVALAWIVAAVCSVPNFFIFRQYQPFLPVNDWSQCLDVFAEQRDINRREVFVSDLEYEQFVERQNQMQRIWQVAHVLSVFLIPTLIVVVCYSIICRRLMLHSETMASDKSDGQNNSCAQSSYSLKANNGNVKTNETEMSEKTHLMAPPGPANQKSLVQREPEWKQQFRAKLFHATFFVILAHVLLWLPYNAVVFIRFADPNAVWLEYADFTTCLIAFNAAINPLLYEFK